jgi:hypothetical protein
MKQSAAKTLGVAALGAAFAAAAAGTASAAPAPLPDSAPSLDAITSIAPVQEAVTTLPAGAPQTLVGGQTALTNGVTKGASTLPGMLQETAAKALPNADEAAPLTGALSDRLSEKASGLLGGMPVGTGSLPVGADLPGLG